MLDNGKSFSKNLFKDTKNYIGKDIIIEGWIRTIRDSKNFGFIELNDGSFFIMYKLYLVTICQTLKKFASYQLVLQSKSKVNSY